MCAKICVCVGREEEGAGDVCHTNYLNKCKASDGSFSITRQERSFLATTATPETCVVTNLTVDSADSENAKCVSSLADWLNRATVQHEQPCAHILDTHTPPVTVFPLADEEGNIISFNRLK